ncbi:hypothetical protein Mal64_08840 [Pseudobythopirellula maris]|uniref:PEP-CTERM protein-sorting domain-containing protein n=1 Tax=Pseudobythopirellula maris TaxID=2527991 RepID=A0A5C5ZW58_9BACT|nr:PEP-CTERM sorting domain-containing protein [Pseudobythopirellula maris]TWT90493.1 hypothetical protein Mal64_08840 [Pseudobythopirellula maris]
MPKPQAFSASRLRLLITTTALLVATNAQAFDVFWTGGVGSWTSGGNWDAQAEPDSFFEDVPIINNGGTATLSTSAIGAAGLVLGQSAGDSGTVIIQPGGDLELIDTPGAASLVPPDGIANIGLAGQALLEVHGGGSFSSTSIDINALGALRVGTAGAGGATVASTGSLFNDGVLEVRGAGHAFTVATNASLEGNSVFVPHLTSSVHSAIGVTGNAALGGVLRPMATGVVPAVGDSWDLIDAETISGGFANTDFSALPALSGGRVYRASVEAGGSGQVLRLGVDQSLTLRVDWSTKEVTLMNQGTDPVTLDGYSVASIQGSLNAASFNGLDDQNVGGADAWQEANPTANSLNELNPLGSLSIAGGQDYLLGEVFAPALSLPFGASPEDIGFEYSTPTGELLSGIVEYVGERDTNNLRLTVDPSTGQAQLRNDGGVPIALDGYSILSGTGSLLTSWQSLDDQNVDGANAWNEAAPTANEVSELNPAASTTITPNQGHDLGVLWDTSGARDLQLVFSLLGEATPRTGAVIFGDLPELSDGLWGDYNGNGVVDAADFTVWRDHLNDPDESALNGNGNGGGVDMSDYDFWVSHFGETNLLPASLSHSASVPEPTGLTLLALALGASGLSRRQPRGRPRREEK